VLTGRENPLYKLLKAVRTKKGRKRHRLFLAEGPHLVEEALNSSYPVHKVIIEGKEAPQRLWPLLQQAAEKNIAVYQMAGTLFRQAAETKSPQGILALVELPEQEKILPAAEGFLGLLLNEVRDPGNLGVILRTARAAGVKDIFLTPGTTDPYSGKAVRSSQGGIFHLNLHHRPLEDFISWAVKNNVKICVGDPRGQKLYYEEDLQGPVLFILGHETEGPEILARKAGKSIKIPLPGGAESLNVAVSSGILLYEVLRQRAAAGESQTQGPATVQ